MHSTITLMVVLSSLHGLSLTTRARLARRQHACCHDTSLATLLSNWKALCTRNMINNSSE